MNRLLSFPAKILFSILALSFMVACWGDEPDVPDPNPPIEQKDTKAPTITVSKSSVNIISGPVVSISGDELKVGDDLVASWKDDTSKSCKVELSFVSTEGTTKTINSGDKLSEPGKLQIKVTDEAGNTSTAEITLTRTDTEAPKIEVLVQEKNVVAGVKVIIEGNQLFFDSSPAASWTDDYSESLTVEMSFIPENSSTGKAIESWETLFDAGKLQITVQDDVKNSSTAEIKLTSIAIIGLESLAGKELTVDVPVNLLEGLTITEGLTLQKVEMEKDGVKSEIPVPKAFSPQIPGTIWIVFTLGRTDGSTFEVMVEGLTVKGVTYYALEIADVNPKDLVPEVEIGDKQVYDHIEYLRVPETTVVRDMMWQYGAGNNSQQQYQQLMGRLTTGLLGENPKGVDSYEIIGGWLIDEPSGHAYAEWSILTSFVKHATFIVVDTWFYWSDLYEYCNNSPSKINIMGVSVGALVNRDIYDAWNEDETKQFDKEKNCLVFSAAGNIKVRDGILNNKIYQEELDLPDESSRYGDNSRAHSKNDIVLDRHLMITVSTDEDGDIDQTNERGESSLFPVGFHDKVLFSGRILPYKKNPDDKVRVPDGKYNTSFTNYVNVVLADLCFQLYAEVADVDELLEMIRSTALTDYIRFDLNGDGDTNDIVDGQPESQPLQLINPAGFIKKYLMPIESPGFIGLDETISLGKGYYKGVIFSIPGAEVKIGDEWIPVTADNSSRIKAANPMDLEWRINGSRLRKYGFSSGQTIEGKMLLVDDQWNGLRLEVPVSIILK